MLKRTALFLLIFSLPFQFGYHFWPNWAYLSGFKIDYLSPAIYLTDILILIYLFIRYFHQFLFFLPSRFVIPSGVEGSLFKPQNNLKNNRLLIVVFLGLIILNIIFSLNPIITFLAWVRFLFYSLFLLTLIREPNLRSKIILPFTLSLFLIISLEIGQFLKQSSLNGLFYYLGERTFDLATPNIAKIDLNNFLRFLNFKFLILNYGLILRPYSTFSHPNSLAGYLLVSLIILKLIKSQSVWLKRLIYLVIIFTFSKAAITSLLVILIISNLTSIIQKNILKTFLLTCILISLFPLIPLPNLPFNFSSSILSRLYLGPATFSIIANHLIFGIGLNNYLLGLNNFLSPSQIFVYSLQPVHSLILLITSELGLSGLILLMIIMKKINRYLNSEMIMLIIIVLITGSVDHYWWTLPQNKLILILFLALIINKQISSPVKREDREGVKFKICNIKY